MSEHVGTHDGSTRLTCTRILQLTDDKLTSAKEQFIKASERMLLVADESGARAEAYRIAREVEDADESARIKEQKAHAAEVNSNRLAKEAASRKASDI